MKTENGSLPYRSSRAQWRDVAKRISTTLDTNGLGRATRAWRNLGHLTAILLCCLGLARIVSGAAVPAKAAVAQILLERAFDRSLVAHHALKPWPWADMAPFARLGVPRLGIDRIVLDTGSGQAMAFGPTILPGGRLDRGTAVIAAHRDTHFLFLQDVRTGDLLTMTALDGRVHRYRVTGAEVVRWDRFTVAPYGGNPELVLATCYPFGSITHGPLRYVVRAVRISG